jgi:sulfhydrogenase subunit beta (sulfur reductase)
VKALTNRQLETFFTRATYDFDVRVPVRLHDGTRSLAQPGEGDLSLCGGPLPQKITAVFFPQMEWILKIDSSHMHTQEPADKPLFVVGWTAADLDCLEFIDKFFNANYRDTVYFDKRNRAVIVAVSGHCGEDGRLQRPAGDKCDIELIRQNGRYIVAPYSDEGRRLVATMDAGVEIEDSALDRLMAESDPTVENDREVIQRASKLLLAGRVPNEFWQRIADRCIACTRCNLACPTCTCFDVFDLATADNGTRRWRLWDSCQLDGFMREAGGHNPMAEERLRTHRRIHHKLAADVVRWGHMTCFLCGRCDRVCPTGIGIVSVCRQMVEEYGEREEQPDNL